MRRPGLLLAGLLVLLADGALLATSWDAFWAVGDEGYYSHTAERLLDGAVLDADVESVHTGYLHFANAAAMAAFGRRLSSLRYPVMALALVQSLLILALLFPRGPGLAGVAAVAATALGLVQFCNPNHYWYALPLAVALICWLTWTHPGSRLRLVVAGVLVGMVAMFNLLPGVLLGIATLAVTLLEVDDEAPGGHAVLARTILAAGLGFVVWYLWRIADPVGGLLFGLCPVLLLGWTIAVVRASTATTLATALRVGAGALVAVLPLVAYHAVHASFGAWWEDAVVRAGGFPDLTYLRLVSFRFWIVSGAAQLAHPTGVADVLNALYWIVLPCAALLTGIVLLVRLARGGRPAAAAVLPVVATLYGPVALRYQIPIYLYYVAPLVVAAWLWMAADWRIARRGAALAGAAALTAVGAVYHAGQPMETFAQVLRGERLPLVESATLPRLDLRATPRQIAIYEAVVAAIRERTASDEPIFALPYSPELYFLAERPNAFRFPLLSLHLARPEDVAALRRALIETPPALVVHRPDDKHNQPVTAPILETIGAHYEPVDTIGPFVLYRPRDPT